MGAQLWLPDQLQLKWSMVAGQCLQSRVLGDRVQVEGLTLFEWGGAVGFFVCDGQVAREGGLDAAYWRAYCTGHQVVVVWTPRSTTQCAHRGLVVVLGSLAKGQLLCEDSSIRRGHTAPFNLKLS